MFGPLIKRIRDNTDNIPFQVGFLALITLIFSIWKMSSTPIFDGDVMHYTKIAISFLDKSNWLINPHLQPRPPLMFWMIALCSKIFGIGPFASYISHSVMSVATVMVLYFFAMELFDKRTGFLSGLFLATTAQYFYQSRAPLMDIPLLLFTLSAVYCIVLYNKLNRPYLYYIAMIFIGLGILNKGLAGLIVPLVAIFTYLFVNKLISKRSIMDSIKPVILGTLLIIVIVSPWLVSEVLTKGRSFLDALWGENVTRYFVSLDGPHKGQAQHDFYVPSILLFIGFLPWAIFIIPAILFLINKYSFKDKNVNFILLWFFLLLAVISFSGHMKIIRYALPLFPLLAIITAKFIADLFNEEELLRSRYLRIAAWSCLLINIPLFIVLLVVLTGRFSGIENNYVMIFRPFIVIFISGLLAGSGLLFLKRLRGSIVVLSIFSIVSYLTLIITMTLYMHNILPYQKIAGQIKVVAKNAPIAEWKIDTYDVEFYLGQKLIKLNTADELGKYMQNTNTVYCITEDKNAYDSLKFKRYTILAYKLDPKTNAVILSEDLILFSNKKNIDD